MLAQRRRRPAIGHRGRREPERVADEVDRALAGERMRQRDLHAAGLDLRVGEDLADIVDRAAGHAELGQPVDPRRLRLRAGQRRQQAIELVAVAHPGIVGDEARVAGQLGRAGELAEFDELFVIADC